MEEIKSRLKIRASGDRRIYMTEEKEFDKFLKSMVSPLEIGIALDILRDITQNGLLRYTPKYYETKHNTSRKTVSRVLTKALDNNVIKKAGRIIIVNPYVALPYNLNDEGCNKLQQVWDKVAKLDANWALDKDSYQEAFIEVFGNREN